MNIVLILLIGSALFAVIELIGLFAESVERSRRANQSDEQRGQRGTGPSSKSEAAGKTDSSGR